MVCNCVANIYFVSELFCIICKVERETETERNRWSSSMCWFSPPSCCSSVDWAMLKTRTRNSVCGCYLVTSTQVLEPAPVTSAGVHQPKAGFNSWSLDSNPGIPVWVGVSQVALDPLPYHSFRDWEEIMVRHHENDILKDFLVSISFQL